MASRCLSDGFRSPAIHRLTVEGSTPNMMAKLAWVKPAALIRCRRSSVVSSKRSILVSIVSFWPHKL
jgi:hypothetical protein